MVCIPWCSGWTVDLSAGKYINTPLKHGIWYLTPQTSSTQNADFFRDTSISTWIAVRLTLPSLPSQTLPAFSNFDFLPLNHTILGQLLMSKISDLLVATPSANYISACPYPTRMSDCGYGQCSPECCSPDSAQVFSSIHTLR